MRIVEYEELLVSFKEAYVTAMKAQEIARQDAAQQMHQTHREMDEMQAWDHFAVEAMKLRGPEATVADRAEICAAFADALIEHRRKTFG